MKLQLKIWKILSFCFSFLICHQASAMIVINEFLADPPAGLKGDANQDGVRNATDDEFIELLNSGGAEDLSGWSLWDSGALRHRFPNGTSIPSWERLVIFGGGLPSGLPGLVQTASSFSLSLNNTGDAIILKNEENVIAAQLIYGEEANQDQSLTRFPEGSEVFQLHTKASFSGKLFSPGTGPNGEIDLRAATAIPEPMTLNFIFIGLLLAIYSQRRVVKI